jgi:ABC-type histidine transport system ATPase subunit
MRVMRTLAEGGNIIVVVIDEMGYAREVSNRLHFLHQLKTLKKKLRPRRSWHIPKANAWRGSSQATFT